MKYTIRTFLLLLLTILIKDTFGQTNTTIDSLLCKEWKLTFYEEAGEKFSPAPDQKDSKMIFYFDHKVKSIEPDNIQNGVWQYNTKSKVLTITDNQTKEVATMKISKLTSEECILEYKDRDGILLKMYMIPE